MALAKNKPRGFGRAKGFRLAAFGGSVATAVGAGEAHNARVTSSAKDAIAGFRPTSCLFAPVAPSDHLRAVTVFAWRVLRVAREQTSCTAREKRVTHDCCTRGI